jgi:hypothetical protein
MLFLINLTPKYLFEGFKTIDPSTGKIKTFYKKQNYRLALSGKHPSHPGVFFKKYKDKKTHFSEEDKTSDIINTNLMQSREEILLFKKAKLRLFIKVLRHILNMPKEKQGSLLTHVIKKFKVEKDEDTNRLYVFGKTVNYKKYLDKTNSDLIEWIESLGIPLKLKPNIHKKQKLKTQKGEV